MARKQKLLPHVETTSAQAIPDSARGHTQQVLLLLPSLKPWRGQSLFGRGLHTYELLPRARLLPLQKKRPHRSVAPIGMPAMKLSERSISRRAPSGSLLADARWRVTPCGSFCQLRPSLSAADHPIAEASLIRTSPTFSHAGSPGAGMEPNGIKRCRCAEIRDQTRYFVSSLASDASNISTQEPRWLSPWIPLELMCMLLPTPHPSLLPHAACHRPEPPG